jgi:hypothetical protein
VAGGGGDQRLGRGPLPRERVAPERPHPRRERLGVGRGTGAPQPPVVGRPHVAAPPVVRSVRVLTRPGPALAPQPPHRGPVPPGRDGRIRGGVPSKAAVVGRRPPLWGDTRLPSIPVERTADRAGHPARRRAAARGVPPPVRHRAGRAPVAEPPQEAALVDRRRAQRPPDLVVETADAVGEVARDAPGWPRPDPHHLVEGRVTAPAGPAPVGGLGALDVVVRFQPQADDRGAQLVRPRRQAQGAPLPARLREVDARDRGPPGACTAPRVEDHADLLPRQAVPRVSGAPWRPRPLVGGKAPVGPQGALPVAPVSRQPVARSSACPTRADDVQPRFGARPDACLPALDGWITWTPAPCGRLARSPWWDATPTPPMGTPSPGGARPVGDPAGRLRRTSRARRRPPPARLDHPRGAVPGALEVAAASRVRPAHDAASVADVLPRGAHAPRWPLGGTPSSRGHRARVMPHAAWTPLVGGYVPGRRWSPRAFASRSAR